MTTTIIIIVSKFWNEKEPAAETTEEFLYYISIVATPSNLGKKLYQLKSQHFDSIRGIPRFLLLLMKQGRWCLPIIAAMLQCLQGFVHYAVGLTHFLPCSRIPLYDPGKNGSHWNIGIFEQTEKRHQRKIYKFRHIRIIKDGKDTV